MSEMNEQQQKSVITIALLAAFADGHNNETERAEVKRIAESLSQDSGVNISALYQDVLLKRASIDAAVAALVTPEAKLLAYELAVCVCDADGLQGDAERAFLTGLRGKLNLDPAATATANTFTANADALAGAPLGKATSFEPAMLASTLSADEQDKLILNYAILNGALELLPDSLASMAIIPLQMKMVYRIGQSYGYQLDQNSIKDFAAAAGVGLTSQVVENIGRKIIGGILGSLGGVVGAAGRQATGSAFSFVTTYALGKVASAYYADGRTLDAVRLKQVFATMAEEAKTLQARLASQIQDKAKTLDAKNIATLVRDA